MIEGRAKRDLRADVALYLRRQYLGPAEGEEEVLTDRPDRVYLVGTLYPRGPSRHASDGDTLGEDDHDDDFDEPIELANSWHPASAAISFLHDGGELTCTVKAARYEHLADSRGWRRLPLRDSAIALEPHHEPIPLFDGAGRLVSVWRRTGDAWLVTVAIENRAEHDDADSEPRTEDCLFQVSLRCEVVAGEVRPYPSASSLSDDPEDEELELQYRNRRVYGVGHGCSVVWGDDDAERITWVKSEMMPEAVVPGVSAGPQDSDVLLLAFLSDEAQSVDTLTSALSGFVDGYADWVTTRVSEAEGIGLSYGGAPGRLVARMEAALARMRRGIAVLVNNPDMRTAFRLANAAMRLQMLQSRHVRDNAGKRGVPLTSRPLDMAEPRWYSFQLAFQLLTLASIADPSDEDREIVDLIWFPTGGGKTEAYLAVAAIEMIHRRLTRGTRGGGTAVITRYTLRMLTAQQFQRAATLICALQLMRLEHERLRRTEPFTVGLWVGGETTPNNFAEAYTVTQNLLREQQPESPFQIGACPWCGTPLVPARRSKDTSSYGFRSTRHTFEIFCPHTECAFAEQLPVLVVDQQIFAEPPTFLVATVDKFARLAWSEEAGAILGRNVHYDPAGLVIQDELHLLSGPLGTTVALYEAAVLGLLSWDGRRPKIVASTATIRSAPEQVRRMYGAEVALFPPSGLTADDSYFSRVDRNLPGRLYIGVMPQAHSQSYATVLSCVALLEAPMKTVVDDQELDAYWTVVAYHNSLRELGRTVTIARDDVDNVLRRHAEVEGGLRTLRRDGVIELTSNVKPSQLNLFLSRLERRQDQPDAVDLVATSNMLSVGIDISRLGLMLMNGQPKTTAEYIQATSRVGRSTVPGLVVTLLRANKPRDRSHYESFKAYHESIYRYVEPTSVTPWSIASRDRSLHAALVILMRHGAGLRGNEDAGDFTADGALTRKAIDILNGAVTAGEPDERLSTERSLRGLVVEWDRRARDAASRGLRLRYRSTDRDYDALLCDFGERREGWETMNSMRSVDRQVRVIAIGETLT